MPLPEFNLSGDLPEGIHPATLEEVITRFGAGTRRQEVSSRLRRIYETAQSTGQMSSLLIFGSYITDKPEPNDVDVILIMTDAFRLDGLPEETAALFDHSRMESEFGASIFWVRPGLLLEPMPTFRAGWQNKRGGGKRGIVEVFT